MPMLKNCLLILLDKNTVKRHKNHIMSVMIQFRQITYFSVVLAPDHAGFMAQKRQDFWIMVPYTLQNVIFSILCLSIPYIAMQCRNLALIEQNIIRRFFNVVIGYVKIEDDQYGKPDKVHNCCGSWLYFHSSSI